MMPATPPKAAVSSTSTPDAFIGVPMHPRNDISVSLDAAPDISSGKGRSIAQDTISDEAVGRPRGVRIAFQRTSLSFPGR